MFTSCRASFVAVIAAGMLLAGCNDAPQESSANQAASNKPAEKKLAELPPDMVAAVSASGTTSVTMHFALKSAPVANQALPIDIAIVPHREFTSVRAHFEAHDALALTSGETLDAVTSALPEKALKHQLVLLPKREGVYMITASVETESEEGAITRVFSIPVIVAAAGGAAEGAPNPANSAASKPTAN